MDPDPLKQAWQAQAGQSRLVVDAERILAEVRRNQRLRRRHRAICFKSHGRTVCRIPRPLVCVAHHNGPTVCRPRKG